MAEEVTRIEIAGHLAGLFANGATSEHDLPDDRRYTELRRVWEDLPLVPVEA
ncbi:hypothetical protein [Streptomyces viridochromogenes]|uniref:Uncharacterized protein n=1 Tax=Streptomyces viridochromogenes Tue57 TaxID=1160705 RepID=L8PBH6_STRVR|nr:hypothetical protein [Streptomyces viridochromogenes]ELS54946.1 hypothetical protein STVIR_4127 [Streptomyces viridochromogenes Tue57]